MTRISSINRHVKNGSHAMTRHIRNFHLLHQFIIANGHDMPIYGSLDTVSADFVNYSRLKSGACKSELHRY